MATALFSIGLFTLAPYVRSEVRCPDPSGSQQGSPEPSESLYYVGDTTTHQCYGGFELFGAASRTCQPNGKWNGITPVCVQKYPYTYETPEEEAASKLGSTLNVLLEISDPEKPNEKNESESVALCGLYKEDEKPLKPGEYREQEHYPWHVAVQITHPWGVQTCMGSIVGNLHVLTAAHCFTTDDDQSNVKVLINDKDAENPQRPTDKKVKAIHLHPNYSVYSKRNRGIDEFYDYDIAVIELNDAINKIKISPKARPICISCTEASRRALQLKPEATCKDQIDYLFSKDVVNAFFVTGTESQMKNMNVKIKLKNQPLLKCNEDALKAPLYTKVNDWKEVVTDRFLCTAGTDPQIDEVTCKGRSDKLG